MLLNINQSVQSYITSRFFPAIFICLLTIFSFILTPGYESFTSDQTLFLPPLYHTLDSSLFPNDLEAFKVMHADRTLLIPFLAFLITKGSDLIWLLFILTIASRIIFFTALYFIAYHISQKHIIALVTTLFFVTPFWIPGTGHTTMDAGFSYHSIALPLALSAVALLLREKYLYSLALSVIGFIIHPITTVPFLLFQYAYIIKDIWQKKRDRFPIWIDITSLVTAAIALAVFVLFFAHAAGNFFLTIDEQWKLLARTRNSPAFFAFWDKSSFLSLGLWVLFGSTLYTMAKQFLEQRLRFLFFLSLAVPLFLLGAALVGEYTSWYGLLKINLQRGIILFTLWIPLLLALYVFHYDSTRTHSLYRNGLLFAIMGWFFWKESFVFLREQMLIFIPPLLVLCWGTRMPFLATRERLRTAISLCLFFLLIGLSAARSFLYADYNSLIIFIFITITSFLVAYLFQRYPTYKERFLQHGLVIACLILVSAIMVHASSFTIYPPFSYNTEYQEACGWIMHNTSTDSIFIVEPFISKEPDEFRLACFRPIFTTFKEGGIVPYDENRQHAFEWKHKYDLAYALQNNLLLIENIKKEYRVDYIFSENPLSLPAYYPLVYSNKTYYVYDIR